MHCGLRSSGTQSWKTTTFAFGVQNMVFRIEALQLTRGLCFCTLADKGQRYGRRWGARVLLGLLLSGTPCMAQPDFQRYGMAAEAAPADPAIAKVLATIDPSRMERTIQALVGFGTRNTLTSMDAGR